MFRFQLIWFALLLLPAFSFAEEVWTSFIASDAVYDIAVQGEYLWCATANGPVRWDRWDMSYTVFNNIPDNRVNCLTTDAKGNIWFGTRNGVFRLDTGMYTFSAVNDGLPCKDVVRLTVGTNGAIYAIVNSFVEPTGPSFDIQSGVYRLDGLKWAELYRNHDSGMAFSHLGIDLNGTVWFDRGSVYYRNAEDIYRMDLKGITWYKKPDVIPEEGTTGLFVQPDGTVWVGAEGKVLRFNAGIWTSYPLGNGLITAFARDSLQTVWAASESGLYRFVNGRWETYCEGSGDIPRDIGALQVDTDGVVWAGTATGLYRLENGRWRHYTLKNRLPEGVYLHTLATDSKGYLWTATANRLLRFNGTTWDSVSVPVDLGISDITAIRYAADGNFWVKTKNEVLRFDGSSWKKYKKPFELHSMEDAVLIIGQDNSVWLQNGGNYWKLFNDSWVGYTSEQPIQTLFVGIDGVPMTGRAELLNDGRDVGLTLRIDSPDTALIWNEAWAKGAWFSYYYYTINSVVHRPDKTFWMAVSYDADQGNTTHPISRIYSFDGNSFLYAGTIEGCFGEMAPGSDGSVWVGAVQYWSGNDWPKGGGLCQYDVSFSYGRVLHAFKAQDGLLGTSVVSVTVGPDGTVWAGTDSGLSRYGTPFTNEVIITTVPDAEPKPVMLLSNRPNPFNPSTIISFNLPASCKSSLIIYDIIGRKVRTLISKQIAAGSHSVVWDGRDERGASVSSGVYLARLESERTVSTRKMLLVK